ncbi:MAG: hypothetical protein ACK5NA_08960 [Enterococcus sp.]
MGTLGFSAFLVVIGVIICLDIAMVISLIRKGDERRQMIVWKSSTYTLLVTVSVLLLDICESAITQKYSGVNPTIFLTVIAVIYFITLLLYKKKYGD